MEIENHSTNQTDSLNATSSLSAIQATYDSYEFNEEKYFNIKLAIVWLSSFIISVGLITNFISFLVFFKLKTLTSTNIYLGSLCASNFLALIGLLINSVLYNKFSLYEYMSGVQTIMSFYPYVYPLIATSQIASIYLTISVSINQFITIAFSKYHNINTNTSLYYRLNNRSNKRAFRVVFMIIMMSILFCSPYWFIFKYSDEDGLEKTSISLDPTFKRVVHFYLYFPFACVIPFLILVITNTYLISTLEITLRRKRRLTLRKSKSTSLKQSQAGQMISNDSKMTRLFSKKIRKSLSKKTKFDTRRKTLMLISFVFFFLVCQLPTLLLNIIESLDQSYKSQWYYNHLVETSKLLLIINLSFNFAIFFMFSKRFRQTIKTILCQKLSKTTHVV